MTPAEADAMVAKLWPAVISSAAAAVAMAMDTFVVDEMHGNGGDWDTWDPEHVRTGEMLIRTQTAYLMRAMLELPPPTHAELLELLEDARRQRAAPPT